MFEHKSEKVISRKAFLSRQLKSILIASIVLVMSLAIGVVGYSSTAHLPFIDSLLNASMILTGMGPVDHMPSYSAKLFASVYAIYSGVAFLTTVSILLAPGLHRFMHKIHLEN
jgi:xanthine/uracil permease